MYIISYIYIYKYRFLNIIMYIFFIYLCANIFSQTYFFSLYIYIDFFSHIFIYIYIFNLMWYTYILRTNKWYNTSFIQYLHFMHVCIFIHNNINIVGYEMLMQVLQLIIQSNIDTKNASSLHIYCMQSRHHMPAALLSRKYFLHCIYTILALYLHYIYTIFILT